MSRNLTGTTLGDSHVERLPGRGGMGEAYVARQVGLNPPVALKVFRPDLLTESIDLSRLEAEATAVAKLAGPPRTSTRPCSRSRCGPCATGPAIPCRAPVGAPDE